MYHCHQVCKPFHPLIKNPDIRVLMSGLQVLCFWPEYCELKVLDAPNHEFRIYVDAICRTTGRIAYRKIFAELPEQYFSLSVGKNWSAGKVYKYLADPFDGDTLEREAFQEPGDGTVVGSDDPHDYRWVVDLGGHCFYNKQVPFEPNVIHKSVYIGRGQFYTAARTTEAFDRVTVRRRGRGPVSGSYQAPTGERRYIGRIALVVGANICVEDDKEEAYLTVYDHPPMNQDAKPRDILLHFDTKKYAYKVAFSNLHPQFADTQNLNDFPEYGNALHKGPNGFDEFDIYDLQPTSRAATDTAPCSPVEAR